MKSSKTFSVDVEVLTGIQTRKDINKLINEFLREVAGLPIKQEVSKDYMRRQAEISQLKTQLAEAENLNKQQERVVRINE